MVKGSTKTLVGAMIVLGFIVAGYYVMQPSGGGQTVNAGMITTSTASTSTTTGGNTNIVGKWTHDTRTPWAGVVEVTFDADGGAQFGKDSHRFRWSGTGSSYTFTGFVGTDGVSGFRTVPPFSGQLGADGQLYVSGFPNPEFNGYWQHFVPAGG